MQDAMTRLGELVPVAISVLAMFVAIVATSTVAYLGWRASRGKSEMRRS